MSIDIKQNSNETYKRTLEKSNISQGLLTIQSQIAKPSLSPSFYNDTREAKSPSTPVISNTPLPMVISPPLSNGETPASFKGRTKFNIRNSGSRNPSTPSQPILRPLSKLMQLPTPIAQTPQYTQTRHSIPFTRDVNHGSQFKGFLPELPQIYALGGHLQLPLLPESPPANMIMSMSPRIMNNRISPLPLPNINPIIQPIIPSLAFQPQSAQIPEIKVNPLGFTPSNETSNSQPLPVATSTNRPNYVTMSIPQQIDMRVMFRTKFGILRSSYPQWNIQDPSEGSTLDQVHDMYENYVKEIIISMNSNQWKIYLIILFLGIEIFGIKVLGMDFKGYTMSQVKSMNRYNRLLVELGEKYYVQGNSNWPIEIRFIITAAINAIIFFAIKYFSKWLGGDHMSEVIQGFVDKILNSEMLNSSGTTRDEHGLPIIAPSASAESPGGGLDLSNILGGLMGGNSGGGFNLNSIISQITSAVSGSNATTASSGQGQPRTRVVFRD